MSTMEKNAPEFQKLLKSLIDEHQPDTPAESLLVEEMAQAHRRLEHVRRRQDQTFSSEAPDAKLLALLLRYATAYERLQIAGNAQETQAPAPRAIPATFRFAKGGAGGFLREDGCPNSPAQATPPLKKRSRR